MGASRHIISGKGIHNARCDSCGLNFKSNELRKRWDGLMVCAKDYETRHPLDFLRVQNDQKPNDFTRLDPSTDFSLSFNGVDSYGIAPFTLAQAGIAANFTVQCDVFPLSVNTSRQALVSFRNANDPGSWQLEIGLGSSATGNGRVALTTPGVFNYETADNIVVANKWQRITYSRSSTGNQIIVVDQKPAAPQLVSFIPTVANTNGLILGKQGATNGNPFLGYLKNVFIYIDYHNQDKIVREQMQTFSTPGTISNMAVWLQLNEGSGTVFTDSTATGGNNGTLSNTTWVNY